MAESNRHLVYHCPITTGGLATYAHYQANALVRTGTRVTLVTSNDYAAHDADYEIMRLHPQRQPMAQTMPHWMRRASTLRMIVAQQRRFSAYLSARPRSRVLMAAYFEYAAPLWAGRYRALRDEGTVFGSVVHDPVRDYVVGPAWWHRRSIAAAYSFLREAFVHAPISLDTCGAPAPRVTVIPHGPYEYVTSTRTRRDTRSAFGIPDDAYVLLAFGHLRDAKNLDLAIHALAAAPQTHLLIAGTAPTAANRPVSHYQRLADSLGVGGRCHWLIEYIGDERVAELFEAADAVLLTYSAQFRSASGVLNTAVSFRKPCLASSGQGDLKNSVERYRIGMWVEPDDANAVSAGLRQLIQSPPDARWDDYVRDHSWEANARVVAERMFEA